MTGMDERLAKVAEVLAEALRTHDWRACDSDEYGLPCRHADHHYHAFCEVCSANLDAMAQALAPLLAQMLTGARAEALREAADQVAGALVNEVGSGHTSTYSVRRWLRDRAALTAAEPDAGEREVGA